MDEPIIIHDNVLEDATLTASSEEVGYPVENIINRREFIQFQGVGLGNIVINADLGVSPPAVRAVAVSGHTLGSEGATFEAEWSDDDITYNSVGSESPTTDSPFAILFNSATHRYWHFTISGHSAAPFVGVVFLGDYLQFDDPPDSPVDPDKTEEEWDESVGGEGHLLGAVTRFTTRVLELTFGYVLRTFITSTWKPFWESIGRNPFFILWAPDSFPDVVYYMRITSEYSAPFTENFCTLRFTAKGLKT